MPLLLFDLLLVLLLELVLSFELPVLMIAFSLVFDMFNISVLMLLDAVLEFSDVGFGNFGDGVCELGCFDELGDDDDDIEEVLVLLPIVDFFLFEPFCDDCFRSLELVDAILPVG